MCATATPVSGILSDGMGMFDVRETWLAPSLLRQFRRSAASGIRAFSLPQIGVVPVCRIFSLCDESHLCLVSCVLCLGHVIFIIFCVL